MAGAFSIHFWEPVMALYFVAEEQAANAETLTGKNAMSGFLAVMNAAPGDIEKLYGVITKCYGTAQRDVVRLGGASRRIFRYLRSG